MIIHSPIISGSLTFAQGASMVTDPNAGVSGSFSGSFQGDGSQLTNVAASGLNIDLLNSGPITGDDFILFSDQSDSGTEKRATLKTALDAEGVFSGSGQVQGEVGGNLIPDTHNAYDLGSTTKYWRDLYLSSGSLYINGQQVLSTTGTEFRITTDAGESIKILEAGNDTITLETENGNITLNASGNGVIELDAPIQVAAGRQVLSSDGNAIVFGEDIDAGTNRISANNIGNLAGTSTFTGSFVGDGTSLSGVTSYTDADNTAHLDSRGVHSGSYLDTATTDNLPEGSTNLYATTANVKSALNASLGGAQNIGDSSDTITIPGNLTVSGTTTTVSSNEVSIGDNVIVLNSDETGTPTQNGGIELERGTETNASLVWSETNDRWSAGLAGSESTILLALGDGVVSGSAQVVGVLSSVNAYTASNDVRVNQLSTETGSISTEQASQDARLTSLESQTGSISTEQAAQDSRLNQLSTETGSISTEQAAQDSRLTSIETFTGSVDTDDVSEGLTNQYFTTTRARAAFSAGTGVSISSGEVSIGQSVGTSDTVQFGIVSASTDLYFEGNLIGSSTSTGSFGRLEVNASTIKIGDQEIGETQAETLNNASGTNTGDVTLAGSYNYLSISGQEITLGQVDAAADISNLTTTNVSEGTNQYFTEGRAQSALSGHTSSTSNPHSVTATQVGLGNVDNTSDANKPVSTATQTALDLKANLASPALTGNPTAPTQTGTDDSTKIATTAFVQDRIDAIIGTAGSTLDTLGELSASLDDDQDALTALTTTVGGKLAKSSNLSDLTDAASARTNLGVDAAGTDNSTNVSLVTTSHDYLSLSGQAITLGQIDISDDTNLAVSDTTGQTGIDMTLTGDTLSATVSGLGTSDDVQFGTVGVGGAADGGFELKVTGDIGATGDVVAFSSSDRRLKDNIELISNPIEKVKELRGVTWEWNEEASEAAKQTPNVGVIAQEVEKVLPELVHDRENGYKGVDYSKLTGLLIEVVKTQQEKIESLESRLDKLEN